MASPRLITKPHYGTTAILLAGSTMCFFFAYLVINGYSSDEFETSWGRWLLGGALAIFALTCLYYVLKNGKVYQDKDEVIFRNLLGFTSRRVKPKEIKGFFEVDRETEYIRSVELRLYFDDGNFKIWSSNYSDYYALRAVLTRKAKNDRRFAEQFERRESLKSALIFMGLGLFFIGIPVYQYLNADGVVSETELITISGTVHDLELDLNKDLAGLTVYLKEFPTLSFHFPERGLNRDRINQAVLNLRRDASLTLYVLSSDHQQKITKESPLPIFRWPGSKEEVNIYAAKDQKYRYLVLSEYNADLYKNPDVWFLALLGLLPLGVGIYMYYQLGK